jgi:hypothetical protein
MKVCLEKLKTLLKEKLTLYPILIGLLFITTATRKNYEIISLEYLVLYSILSLSFCIIIYLTAQYLIKNKIKDSLISFLIIIINFYYNFIFNWIYESDFGNQIFDLYNIYHPSYFVAPVLCIICFILIILVIKTNKNLFRLNLFLNSYITILLVLNVLISISARSYTKIELIDSPDSHSGKLIDSLRSQKPDIFYIILDSYTSSASLKKFWNYNNSQFEDSLLKMGFFVTRSSKSDYDYTPYCMASYLNMSLLKLDSRMPSNELYKQPFLNTLELIKKSRAVNQIINSGYTFKNYSIFEIGNTKKLYSVWNDKEDVSFDSFFQATIFTSLKSKMQSLFVSALSPPRFPNTMVLQGLIDSINYTENIAKFFYVHIMMPHHPFDYDETGRRTDFEHSGLGNDSYLKQLRYTNTLTVETIRKILQKENKRPIIIIQGDHGYRFLKKFDYKIRISEGHSIFSAYLFPDSLKINLKDSITPIQALSILFDKYK